MIPELLVIAIIIGWIMKGKFNRLADVKIKYIWMMYVTLGLYLAAVAVNLNNVLPKSHWVFGLVHIIGLFVLIAVALINRQIPGVKIVFAGLVANAVAIVSNTGFMPTSREAIISIWGKAPIDKLAADGQIRHAIIDAGTRCYYFCDIIAARKPFVLVESVYSIGDIFISLGCVIAIIAIMRTPLPSEKFEVEGAQ